MDKYGNVVTQARVLMNNANNTLKEYQDNCVPEYNKRKGKSTTEITKSTLVLSKVIPNPNNGNFVLQYNLGNYVSANLVIYDITGKLMLSESLNNTGKQIDINATKFENGVYYYTIRTSKEILTTNKFVIIK